MVTTITKKKNYNNGRRTHGDCLVNSDKKNLNSKFLLKCTQINMTVTVIPYGINSSILYNSINFDKQKPDGLYTSFFYL